MPRRGCSKFHQLSDRSKRRRVNEDEGCSYWSNNSDNNFSSRLSDTKKSSNTSENDTDPANDSNTFDSSHYNLHNQAVEDNDHLSNEEVEFNDDNYEITFLDSSSSENIFEEYSPLGCQINDIHAYYSETTTTRSSGIENFLRNWAIRHNVTSSAVSDLLAGLKENVDSLTNILPSDARTLLKTNLTLENLNINPGKYIHFGLETQLKFLLKNANLINIHELHLLVNVDGLPLFKSSPGQAIPILVSLVNIPTLRKIVFPVGLYYGYQKPDDMDLFLHSFVTEIIELSNRGLLINNTNLNVKIIGFVCDAPAKKDILGINDHGGYFSCTRCKVRGRTMNNKRVFTELNCEKRTHNEFINWIDKNYQLRSTILTQIPGLELVDSINLDVMHLVFLGIMRTME